MHNPPPSGPAQKDEMQGKNECAFNKADRFSCKPIVWTIAGSDSGGGAGIQADLLTFQDFGVHGCSVLTALTAQNSHSVIHIESASVESLEAQITALDADLPPQAIKIGVLGSRTAVEIVSRYLQRYQTERSGFVVFDPVMVSTSGSDLSAGIDTKLLAEHIFPYVDLITPNLIEAYTLLPGTPANTDKKLLAQQLCAKGAKAVLLKGGHEEANQDRKHFSQDYYTTYNPKTPQEAFYLTAPRINSPHTHGSGCTLSSAIAACIALEYSLPDALVIAKAYVTQGIRLAKRLGHQDSKDPQNHQAQGPGPVIHAGWPTHQADIPFLTPDHTTPYTSLAPQHTSPAKADVQPPYPDLPFPRCQAPLGFYPIVDSVTWVKHLLERGVKTLQLRIKDQSPADITKAIEESIALGRTHQAQLFINDHWQLAIEHSAYGVHLGQEDLDTADMPAIQAAGLRLGISTHCYSEVARALALQPSYIACGPIYLTTAKPMAFDPQGIETLKRWQQTLTDYPLVAIGGITLENLGNVLATGVDGFAVISTVTQAANPNQAIEAFLSTQNEHQRAGWTPALSAYNKHQWAGWTPAYAGEEELSHTSLAPHTSPAPQNTSPAKAGVQLTPDILRTPSPPNRYLRQIILPEIALLGQQKLQQTRVLCIGAGGLGCPLLLYLAGAGIGTLGIVDDDIINEHNLHRQILYTTQECGQQKTPIAAQKLTALNPDVTVVAHTVHLDASNAADIIAQYDIVADGSDNFETRYLVNDTCFALEKPLISASIVQFSGQLTTFHPPAGPCYRCLFPEPDNKAQEAPNCNTAGVLGPAAGTLGALQAIEVIKAALGNLTTSQSSLLTLDLLNLQFQSFEVTRDPECTTCGPHTDQAHSNMGKKTKTNTNDQQTNPNIPSLTITPKDFEKLQDSGQPFTLVDVRTPEEHANYHIGGTLIPLDQLPAHIDQLNPSDTLILYCKSGHRSLIAAQLLYSSGFHTVASLSGGIGS
jgi:hydroxymethylpyrimidine kinase/phosphomethylpyrimidine kinase/thiamine-phosphate diphosphorylase